MPRIYKQNYSTISSVSKEMGICRYTILVHAGHLSLLRSAGCEMKSAVMLEDKCRHVGHSTSWRNVWVAGKCV